MRAKSATVPTLPSTVWYQLILPLATFFFRFLVHWSISRENRVVKWPSTESLMTLLELVLTPTNQVFGDKHYLQVGGTVMKIQTSLCKV